MVAGGGGTSRALDQTEVLVGRGRSWTESADDRAGDDSGMGRGGGRWCREEICCRLGSTESIVLIRMMQSTSVLVHLL